MVGSPRLYAPFGTAEALGQCVEALEAQLCRHVTLILAQYFLAEILLKVFADDEDNLAESGLDGIVDRVVHYGLAVGAESVELLEPSVAAAHAGGQE